MKKQQLAALCLAAGLALTGITSPVSAAQTGTGISMSADSTSDTQTSSSKKEGTATDSESNSANQNRAHIPLIQLFSRNRRFKLLR